jgi:hypothetical protein
VLGNEKVERVTQIGGEKAAAGVVKVDIQLARQGQVAADMGSSIGRSNLDTELEIST